ncbi:MAG: tRNA lysidine(34) synthetase TilS, partial [Bacteroidota bacterium]
DRKQLIIKEMKSDKQQEFLIATSTTSISLENLNLTFQILTSPPVSFPNNRNIAYFDYEKLAFPLKLRHWQAGDRFQPLGMNGKSKKLQDFFSDLKLSRFEKEQVWLLESADEICWVIGYRMDERFRLGEETKKILMATTN